MLWVKSPSIGQTLTKVHRIFWQEMWLNVMVPKEFKKKFPFDGVFLKNSSITSNLIHFINLFSNLQMMSTILAI